MSLFNRVFHVAATASLAILAACVVPAVGHADEVIVGSLSITPTDNPPVTTMSKIKLSPVKPAMVKAEPAYRGTPLYGIITLGNAANNKTVVVLDTFPNDTKPKLFVDVNGNGDLTDDTVNHLMPIAPAARNVAHHTSNLPSDPSTHTNTPMGVVVPTFLTRYDIKGSVREEKTPLQFLLVGTDLTYSASVAHLGTLSIGDRQFRIALVDQAGDGIFNAYAHSEDSPSKVLILVDRNHDGKFDLKREAFDLAKPFRVAGSAYEVASIDARGTIIGLKKTSRPAEGSISAEDLAVGGDVIDFAVKMIDGKMVRFPDDYKHKVVMLDFWAMWCGPCMMEMPNVVSTYNEFHQYGFEILGVSLDHERQLDTLIGFLPQNQMSWSQIYDGKYWQAEIAKLYGVDSIPRAILVDGDTGAILAMGDSLRGDGLTRELRKALAKKRR